MYNSPGPIKKGQGSGLHPLNNYENIGFLIINCPDPLNNHKATKPACKVWPSSARQRNAISMAIIHLPAKRHFNGHYPPASETPFKHRLAGEPMMVFSDKQISILSNNKMSCMFNVCTSQKTTIFLNFIDEIDPRTDINLLVGHR